MSVEVLTPEELECKFKQLHNVLSSLPEALPLSNQFYNFQHFAPDPELEGDFGLAGAVNHALEITFAPMGRINGIRFLERGPGLVAVVDVLRKYITAYPADVVLQKWVLDLIKAGSKAGGSIVSSNDTQLEFRQPPSGPPPPLPAGQKRKNSNAGGDQPKKQQLLSAADTKKSLYIEVEWVELDSQKGRGGRKRDPLVEEVVTPVRSTKSPGEPIIFRCVGAFRGCEKTFDKNTGYRERLLVHAAGCGYVSSELKQRVNDALGRTALGSEVTAQRAVTPALVSLPPSSLSSQPTGSSLPTLSNWTKSAGRADLNTKTNKAILIFLCACALPPTTLDRKEWKDVLACASNGQYQPISSRTFVDSLIPREAGLIHGKQLREIRKYENLTISFDGGTTAGMQSVYTVHVTTPERRSYLIEGNEASTQSHTGEHLFQVLDQTLKLIDPKLFRAITSDNMGNTTLARRKVRDAYPWILILPDPCHRLNLLCKDIAKVEHFSQVVKDLRRTIKFFSSSTGATSKLTSKRSELGIARGIETIGKTRFGTLYFAALSVQRNYRAISDLCKASKIEIKDVNHLFLPGRPALEFEYGLQELTMVLAPIAKAITCLESSHSTVADVYYFFLAVAAEMHRIIVSEHLSNRVKGEMRRIMNYRFDQMVNQAPSDVYLCGFILDPRFRGADIMHDLNPLAIQKLRIPARDASGKSIPTSYANGDSAEPALPSSLRRAGTFLLGMLRTHYEYIKKPIAGLSAQDANIILRQQIVKYIKGTYPFDRPFREQDHAGEWWKQLDMDQTNDAQPLAKLARTIFEILPNSMVEERTASAIKWYNSRLRNRQQVATLTRMVTIRQWYRDHDQMKTKPFRPTIKFRDMDETIYGKKAREHVRKEVKEGETDHGSHDDEQDMDSDIEEKEADHSDTNETDAGDDEDDVEAHRMYSDQKLELENTIDIGSPVLLDLLADDDRALDGMKEKGKGKNDGRNVIGRVEVKEPDMDLGKDDSWIM